MTDSNLNVALKLKESTKRLPFFLVLGLAVFLFLYRIGQPPTEVFDEIIYPGGAISLLGHFNSEQSHPPLGKMIMAASAYEFGENVIAFRLPSALFGVLLLGAIGALTLKLTGDWLIAAGGMFLSLCNGLLFVLSRVATLDVYATCFLFWGIWAIDFPLVCGLLLGLAMCTKWLALFPLLAILVTYRKRILGAVQIVAGFLVGYLAPMFGLARMERVKFDLWWLWTQQTQIFGDHAGHIGPHWSSSRWYTWPFKLKPQIMYYSELPSHILLLGSPVILWGGLIALVWLARNGHRYLAYWFLILWLQYAIMPLSSTFYHYYFAAALCLGPALAITVHHYGRKWQAALYLLAGWQFFLIYPALSEMTGGRWLSWL